MNIGRINAAPWIIFILLLLAGLRATRPGTVPLRQIWFMPIIICLWLMISVFKYQHSLVALGCFALGIALGCFIWRLLPRQKFVINRAARTISYEGTWVMLPLFMSVFIVRYAFGYMHATNHWFIAEYAYIESLAAGCISGIFLAGMLNRYYHYRMLTR